MSHLLMYACNVNLLDANIPKRKTQQAVLGASKEVGLEHCFPHVLPSGTFWFKK